MLNLTESSVVTFDGKVYPEYGHAVVLAGGAGSGKGYIQNVGIPIDAKVLDVDHLKQLYTKALKHDTSVRDTAIKKGDKLSYDFKNDADVSELHGIVDDKGYSKAQQDAFFNSRNPEKLTNVIFDITGKNPSKLADYGKKLKAMGYTTTFVWVVCSREKAALQNLWRSRVVSQKLFHTIHNEVKKSVFTFLNNSSLCNSYDNAWIIFTSEEGLIDLTDEQKYALRKERAFKLKKTGSGFEIPNKLLQRLYTILGPNETNPDNPEVYIDYADMKSKSGRMPDPRKYDGRYGRFLRGLD